MPLVTPDSIMEAVPLSPRDGSPPANAVMAATEAFQAEALAYLRRRLGATRTAEIGGWEDHANAENAAAYQKLRTAASLLAYAAALPGTNMRALPEGGIVTSTGFEANRVEFVGMTDIARMQADLRARADVLIDDFPPPPRPSASYQTVRSLR